MILTLGDSVCWGQGLIEEHKFDSIFADARRMKCTRVAHSGAVIGALSDTSTQVETGEVPVAFPSVWQQILARTDWSQVELVLMNGGINDISVGRILSPLTTPARLTQMVDQFCLRNMQGLLEALAAKLAGREVRIAVIGYYPILSDQSRQTETQLRALLELNGVATSSVFAPEELSVGAFVPGIIANCITFWQESNRALQAAVDGANAAAGRNVALFVKLPFAEENAMWAPQSLLWELTPLLLPEDEVSNPRGAACAALYGDIVHFPRLIQCQRASAGHPRVQGAATIANTLLAVL